jgi:hypothetical protein
MKSEMLVASGEKKSKLTLAASLCDREFYPYV